MLEPYLTQAQSNRPAQAVAFAALVREGSNLVWIQGNGAERNNLEAITPWIRQTTRSAPLEPPASHAPEFAQRLSSLLGCYL